MVKWKKVVGIIATIVLFIVLFELFGGYGIAGYFIIIIGIGLYRLYHFREMFLVQLRFIESTLFGRPLEKEYYNKGEKPRLKKFVWRKKKK